MKYINTLIFSWVVLTAHGKNDLENKLNELPTKIVWNGSTRITQGASIIGDYTIIYWDHTK